MFGTRIALDSIAVPSTELYDVTLHDEEGPVSLTFRYERDDEDAYSGGYAFDRVRAYRHRAESHCTEWHIADVYDTLAELQESQWVAELLADTPADMRVSFELHHYMIYLDSLGCYEVIAKGWRKLPETPVDEG